MAHLRQSRLGYDLGFRVTALQPFEGVPSSPATAGPCPSNAHPKSLTRHPKLEDRNPKSETLQPHTLTPTQLSATAGSATLKPRSGNRNSKTRNRTNETRNPSLYNLTPPKQSPRRGRRARDLLSLSRLSLSPLSRDVIWLTAAPHSSRAPRQGASAARLPRSQETPSSYDPTVGLARVS